MTGQRRPLVLAAFDDREAAERALDEVRGTGVQPGDVGLVVRSGEAPGVSPASGAGEPAEAGAGALVGGVTWGGAPGGIVPGLGVVLASGVLSSLLTGLAGGSIRSLAEDLADKGVPEDLAAQYDDAFRAGQAVVAVRAEGRAEEIAAVLRRCGGRQLGTR
jgi:hypothetical protein